MKIRRLFIDWDLYSKLRKKRDRKNTNVMSNQDKRKNFAIRPAQEFKLRTPMHANDPQNSSELVQCGLPGKLASGGFFIIKILVAQDSYQERMAFSR